MFDDARKSEAEILDALRRMEDEEARLLDDARKISENMKNARSIASLQADKLPRISNEDRSPDDFSWLSQEEPSSPTASLG